MAGCGCPRASFVAVGLLGAAMLVVAAVGARAYASAALSAPAAPGVVAAASEKPAALSFVRDGSIMLASADGKQVSTVRRAHGTVDNGVSYLSPAWSADGCCLAAVVITPFFGHGIFEVTAWRGKKKFSLGPSDFESSPSWEPNGRRIVFADDEDDGGLEVQRLGSGDWAELATEGRIFGFYPDGSPTWSPNGETIAFQRSEGGDPHEPRIYLIRPDNTGLQRLTTTDAADPGWSPDGKRLVFDDGRRIGVINADGTGLKYLTEGSNRFFNHDPAWSPGGRTIAYVRSSSRQPFRGDIWLMKLGGGGPHLYIRNAEDPAWKPG